MRPVITSKKHYIQQSLFAIASGARTATVVVTAVKVADVTAANEVEDGSLVKAVYIEMWGTSDDTAAGSSVWCLYKIPSGGASITAAEMASLDSYDNKKNILHTGMGLLGPNVQVPMNLVKGWFKIPKGKQRFGLGDRLEFAILAQSNGMAACGFELYKEYT